MRWDVEVIWKRRSQACGPTTPLWPLFQEHVGLIWLHFVGLSAPALFHLKIIISYGNSDVKLIWVGLWAVNKLELLSGVGVASLCRPPLPSPVFWVERSGRQWVAHLGESVQIARASWNRCLGLAETGHGRPPGAEGGRESGSLGHTETGDGMLERFHEQLLP